MSDWLRPLNRMVCAMYVEWCHKDLNNRFRDGYPPGGFPYRPRLRTRIALKVLIWRGAVKMIGNVPIFQRGKL